MAQVVSGRPLIVEDRVQCQATACQICGGQVLPCVLSFSTVSIIPPVLIIHSFIYLWRCISVAVDKYLHEHTNKQTCKVTPGSQLNSLQRYFEWRQ